MTNCLREEERSRCNPLFPIVLHKAVRVQKDGKRDKQISFARDN
jgi:hypothetical protein